MAKRRLKGGTLAQLEARLTRLDQDRAAVVKGIRAVVAHLLGEIETGVPDRPRPPASTAAAIKPGRKAGFKQSAAAKAKMRAAWKKRKAEAAKAKAGSEKS